MIEDPDDNMSIEDAILMERAEYILHQVHKGDSCTICHCESSKEEPYFIEPLKDEMQRQQRLTQVVDYFKNTPSAAYLMYGGTHRVNRKDLLNVQYV
jgi:hypothetical protein